MPFLCHSLNPLIVFVLTGGGNKRKEHNVKVEVNFCQKTIDKENVNA